MKPEIILLSCNLKTQRDVL